VSEITRILEAAQRGEPSAASELLPLVYGELRRLAAHKMAQEPGPGFLNVHMSELRKGGKYTIKGQPQVDDFSALLRSE
jgi:hypothetical protein